jgi:hypothetical protein
MVRLEEEVGMVFKELPEILEIRVELGQEVLENLGQPDPLE